MLLFLCCFVLFVLYVIDFMLLMLDFSLLYIFIVSMFVSTNNLDICKCLSISHSLKSTASDPTLILLSTEFISRDHILIKYHFSYILPRSCINK